LFHGRQLVWVSSSGLCHADWLIVAAVTAHRCHGVMAYETISALRCHCEFCGHQWITEVLPERCAKCKRRTWNRVRGVEPRGHGGRDGSGTHEQLPAHGRRGPARSVVAWTRTCPPPLKSTQ
jgi:hypothetical protein